MDRKTLPRLYLVTDRNTCAGGDILKAVEEALEAGSRFVQLREKDLPGKALLAMARRMRQLTACCGALLIINDRVDVAVLAGADGVHLGQRGFSPGDARAVLGEGKLIGVSAHSLEEAQRAEKEGADFITLGPVFHTPSKAPYGEPIGLGPIRKARDLGIPVYAIGGIKKDRVKDVISAGAYGVAVISAILGSGNSGENTGALLGELCF